MFACCYFWYLVLFSVVLSLIFVSICFKSSEGTPVPAKTMIILGSGGHTKEMLSLTETLSASVYSPRIYVYSNSDTLSRRKAIQFEEERCSTDYTVISISRARAVGQSWISSVFTTVASMAHAAVILLTVRPKLILCNGPGVCVPLCLMAIVAKKLFIFKSKIVYVESICRLKTLSLSGLILRHFVDKFLVQWEDQAKAYPGTVFAGRLA